MAAEYHLTPVVALVSSFIFLHIRLLKISVGEVKENGGRKEREKKRKDKNEYRKKEKREKKEI